MKAFTVKDALIIQADQFKTWEGILTQSAFEEVAHRLGALTSTALTTAKSGYDIPRGCQIDEIVANYAWELRRNAEKANYF